MSTPANKLARDNKPLNATERIARRGMMQAAALAFGKQPISRRGRRKYDGGLNADGTRRSHRRAVHKAHVRKNAAEFAREMRKGWAGE